MTTSAEPATIKRCANRLCPAGVAGYGTLEDLALTVENDQDFLVFAGKTGETFTRSGPKLTILEHGRHG